MTFFFQKLFARYPGKAWRVLEVLPGCLSWLLILSPIWGALLIPWALAFFYLAFDLYWLYKSFALVVCFYLAAGKIKRAEQEDWLQKAESLPHFSRVTHVIIIPNYQERLEKLRATLQALARQTFPRERLFVVLAMEQREPAARTRAQTLLQEFHGVFGDIQATHHPDVVGEVKGKSSNEAFAARVAYRQWVEAKQIELTYTTISSVDADSLFDRQYFAYLCYVFLASPRRHHTIWQSANVSFTNFWQVPAAVRVVAFLESLWRVALLIQPGRLVSNSTYSLSFKMLVDIDFWDVDVIPEDYRLFFKAFYRLKGQAWVEPIFLKTSMDSPHAAGYLQTIKSKYEQERRWAWGVSEAPLFLQWWLTVPGMPFVRKTVVLYFFLLDHILWPANWFLLTLAARLIPLINPVFSHTPAGAELLSLGGLLLTPCIPTTLLMVFDLRRQSVKPGGSKIRQLLFAIELVLLPVTGFCLNALPGLVSHTQLMLGKRLEYKVTEKH